ncbi:MAG: DUF6062 family protein [Bacillota bacterium]
MDDREHQNKGNADSVVPADDIKPDLERLRVYSQAKMNLASQLWVVRDALKVLGVDQAEGQCRELVVKLAEDHFTLAVLGQFKRGKSSLINAIIGRELLPTGVLPLTSAITTLRYGPEERLVISREGSMFADELPVAALPEYVTEKGNPANQKKVKSACVELPVPLLRRGLEFVDTPGVGSAVLANTEITYGFLPRCDAVIFVTGIDTPMTSTEISFLRLIREYVDKVFFVVNKIDTATENERDEVLRFVAGTVKSQIGSGVVKLFPVSSRLGLNARISGDAALYEFSGLKALEESLASFLSEEKSAVLLASIADKTLRILEDESERGVFGDAAIQERARAIRSDNSGMIKREPYEAAAAIMEARSKIQALYDSIVEGRIDAAAKVEDLSTTQPQPSREPTMTVLSLEAENLKTRGCPVCRHIAQYASNLFVKWQYQLATSERSQSEFAAELGFCPLHTWQLLSVCSPLRASTGFSRLSEHVSHQLKKAALSHAGGKAVRWLVRDSRSCSVCGALQQVEDEYINQFAAQLGDASFRSRYRRSQGVCLRHLGMIMDAVQTEEIREFLLSHAAARFEQDAEDMRSYALKREALRRHLVNRNEEDAYRRAIVRMVGERGVCALWAEDGEI